MKAKDRREAIIDKLSQSEVPVTASDLAQEFGVSRQIIVGDVALLRAANYAVVATNQGYMLASALTSATAVGRYRGKIACSHSGEDAEKELRIIVSLGGAVEDVEVDHPIYGVINASLRIESDADIDRFLEKMDEHQGEMLSSLTNGVHIHTINAATQNDFEAVKMALRDEEILLSEN